MELAIFVIPVIPIPICWVIVLALAAVADRICSVDPRLHPVSSNGANESSSERFVFRVISLWVVVWAWAGSEADEEKKKRDADEGGC